MILYLIRHGQSTYNAEGRIQGQSDVPLSPLGRRQGQAVARALAGDPIETIFASRLRRAAETAEFLARALGLTVTHDPRLVEVDAGEFQDRMRAEILVEHPGVLARWRSGQLDFAFPGGESRRDVIRRGREALEAICHAGHAHAAVVSHGGLILAGMKELLGLHSTDPPHDLANASITRMAIDPSGRAELLDFDNVDHLVNGQASADEAEPA